MQTRKQACRIASKDSAPFRIIQLKAFRDALFGLYSQVSAQVRKISTKHNLINPRYVAQHAEYRIAGRKSGVPIHLAEHVSSDISLLATRDEAHLVDDRKPRGKVGDRSSSVRKDVFHIWCTCEPVRVMHLGDSAICISREVQQVVGETQQMRCRIWRRVWVHKDHRLAALKFCEDRLQSSVSQIHTPGVSKENNTIESEDVERVR